MLQHPTERGVASKRGLSELATFQCSDCLGVIMAIFGTIKVVRDQTKGWPGFDQAFNYLDEVLKEGSEANLRVRAMAAGEVKRVELREGLYAMEQAYESKVRYDAFESHRKYIDIQVLVGGAELMEVADISRLPVSQPFDPERDVIIYGNHTATSVLRMSAGDAAVFRPEDAHMPNLRVGPEPSLVRKVVVKVPVSS
jgi:biofilm protein TabA